MEGIAKLGKRAAAIAAALAACLALSFGTVPSSAYAADGAGLAAASVETASAKTVAAAAPAKLVANTIYVGQSTKDVDYYAYKSGSSSQSKTIRNGAKFSVPKKTNVNINVQLVNVKSGEAFFYNVGFYR